MTGIEGKAGKLKEEGEELIRERKEALENSEDLDSEAYVLEPLPSRSSGEGSLTSRCHATRSPESGSTSCNHSASRSFHQQNPQHRARFSYGTTTWTT